MAILRKLYQQGNSVVVSIPTYILDDLNLKIGDKIALTRTPRPSIELLPLEQTDKPINQTGRNRSQFHELETTHSPEHIPTDNLYRHRPDSNHHTSRNRRNNS